MSYHIAILPAALRQLAKLPEGERKRIREKIDRLAIDPYPSGVKKLEGRASYYRIRSGNYRIIYTVEHEQLTVLVLTVGHRREIYRTL